MNRQSLYIIIFLTSFTASCLRNDSQSAKIKSAAPAQGAGSENRQNQRSGALAGTDIFGGINLARFSSDEFRPAKVDVRRKRYGGTYTSTEITCEPDSKSHLCLFRAEENASGGATYPERQDTWVAMVDTIMERNMNRQFQGKTVRFRFKQCQELAASKEAHEPAPPRGRDVYLVRRSVEQGTAYRILTEDTLDMVLQKTKASGTDALIYICNSKGADSQLRYKMPLSFCPNNSENCDKMGDIIDRLAQLSTACEGLIYRTQSKGAATYRICSNASDLKKKDREFCQAIGDSSGVSGAVPRTDSEYGFCHSLSTGRLASLSRQEMETAMATFSRNSNGLRLTEGQPSWGGVWGTGSGELGSSEGLTAQQADGESSAEEEGPPKIIGDFDTVDALFLGVGSAGILYGFNKSNIKKWLDNGEKNPRAKARKGMKEVETASKELESAVDAFKAKVNKGGISTRDDEFKALNKAIKNEAEARAKKLGLPREEIDKILSKIDLKQGVLDHLPKKQKEFSFKEMSDKFKNKLGFDISEGATFDYSKLKFGDSNLLENEARAEGRLNGKGFLYMIGGLASLTMIGLELNQPADHHSYDKKGAKKVLGQFREYLSGYVAEKYRDIQLEKQNLKAELFDLVEDETIYLEAKHEQYD